jgi:hypothetical protein
MDGSAKNNSEETRRRKIAEEESKKPSDRNSPRKSTKKIHGVQTAKFS